MNKHLKNLNKTIYKIQRPSQVQLTLANVVARSSISDNGPNPDPCKKEQKNTINIKALIAQSKTKNLANKQLKIYI